MNDENEFLNFYSLAKNLLIKNDGEVCAFYNKLYFDSITDFSFQGRYQFDKIRSDVLVKRLEMEENFHTSIITDLLHNIQAMKYYGRVDVLDSRRLVAVNKDCISMVQVLIRDKIHIIVHFRSSDFNGALPADLRFISEIPMFLLRHFQKMKNERGYEECNEEMFDKMVNLPVELSLSFGSLHMTNKVI